MYRRVNSAGAAPGGGAGIANSTWAEKFLETMIAFAEVHSTMSVRRPEVRISRRVISAGITIGSPDKTKSSQCPPDAGFAAVVAGVFDSDEAADCQQKCVFSSSEAEAGTESMEMKDFAGLRSFVGAEEAGAPSETR